MVEDRIAELENQVNNLKNRIEKLEKHTHITEVGHIVRPPILLQ